MIESHVTNAGMSLLSDIVSTMPQPLYLFFDRLISVRKSPQAMEEINALNIVLRDNPKNDTTFLLAIWFEIFRNIYVMNALEQEKGGYAPKHPLFTTFNMTFEQLAFTPNYWFETPHLIKTNLINSAEAMRLMFERYMYTQNGGNCWAALDWEMEKYAFRSVCEPMRKLKEDPILKIASLYLTARAIACGELGIYIGTCENVILPYAGIKIDRENPSTLLKNFHYDRFTKLSLIRESEFAMDSVRQTDAPCIETDWMATSAISEFIIQNKNARATRNTCTRVMLEAFSNCLKELSRPTALGKKEECMQVINTIQVAFDFENNSFASKSPTELLHEIGVSKRLAAPDYYLAQLRIGTAEDFWRLAEPIISEMVDKYEKARFDVVPRFTARELVKHKEEDLGADSLMLMNVLLYRYTEELQGNLFGIRLRNAIKNCIIHGQIEIQYPDLAMLLDGQSPPEKLGIVFLHEGCCRLLNSASLSRNSRLSSLKSWAEDILTTLATTTFQNEQEEKTQKSRSGRKGLKNTLSAKTPPKPRSYVGIDLHYIMMMAEKIWNVYLNEHEICRNRWLLSLHTALSSPSVKKNTKLQSQLQAELADFDSDGHIPSAKELQRRLEKVQNKFFTLADVPPKERRMVILSVLARLMVVSAEQCPAIWQDAVSAKMLVMHILTASIEHYDKPFPWHMGLTADSSLRISRGDDNQWDNITRIMERRFTDQSEIQMLMVFLSKYISESDNPVQILDKIISCRQMAIFCGIERLKMLKSAFGENV